MAAVTLQDLMNPLTKIQAATESSAESLDALTVAVATGKGQRNVQTDILRKIQVSLSNKLSTLVGATRSSSDSLGAELSSMLGLLIEAVTNSDETGLSGGELLAIREQKIQTKLLQQIAAGKGGSPKGKAVKVKKGEGKVSDSFKEGGEALQLLGAGTKDLATGLALFKKVPKKAITKFNDLITGTFKRISEFKSKDLKDGAESFEIISNSISKFAKGLVVAAFLLPIGIVGAKLLNVALGIITPAFLKLSEGGKDLKEAAKSFQIISNSIGTFAKALALAALLLPIGIIGAKLLNVALGIVTPAFMKLSEGGKDLKEGAKAFQIISSSIGTFAKNLALAALLLPIGLIGAKLLEVALGIIIPTFSKLGKEAKTIKKGAEVLDLISSSMLKFAKNLALAGLLAIVGLVAIPFLLASLVLIGGAMFLLGKISKPIRKGAKALDRVGDALKSFAVGLALFAITTFFIMMQPEILLGMVASIVLIGGAVAIIGLLNKQINKGSLSLMLMGAGLIVFGIGYAIFATFVASTAPTIGAVGIQLAVLGGIGLVTALLGAGLSLIAQGALSLFLMGVGLAIFGIGYTPFAKATKDATLDSVAVQAGVLTALGLVFAAAGLGVIPITAGAVAFGAVGLALMALAPGLTAMKGVNFTEQDALNLTTTLAGVKMAFLGPPNKGGVVSGIFKSIGGAISGGADAVAMTAAAVGFAAAGTALTKLSKGLKDYQKLGWTADESVQLTTVLTGVTGAFAAAGGEAATPTGLFGAVFGNAFSPNATKKGIDSVMGAGKALTSIVVGLTEFQKLVDSKVDFDVLGEAISKTVGFIQRAFAAVAEEGNVEAGGFFGSLFGIEKNKVAEGLASVQGAGKALKDIALGLGEFQKLVESNIDFDAVGAAISKSVGFVQQAFAAVADEGNVDAGGFFGSLFGIKKNKVQEGVQSVQGAGKALKDIALGLSEFQKLVESNVDFDAVGAAISKSIGFVQEAFAAVAEEGNVEAGGFWSSLFGIKKNKVAEGVAAVQGAGTELNKIATALETFAGLKDPEATANSIKQVLGMVGSAFASIGGAEETDGNWFMSWDENLVEKGIDAVDGAGDALIDIAAGLKAFSGDFDPVSVAESIGTLLTSIGTAFSDLYKTNPLISPQLHDFSSFIVTLGDVAEKGLLDKAAEGISKIADSINKIDIDKTVAFGDLFKSSSELSDDRGAYKALARAVEDIRDMMAEPADTGFSIFGPKTEGESGGNSSSAPAASKSSSSNKALERQLGKVASAISGFPAEITTAMLGIPDGAFKVSK